MNQKTSMLWFSMAGGIGVLFGVFYGLFGLGGLPVYHKFVPESVLASWSNGLYGSAFIGFSVLLLFVGRYAFKKNDKYLMKILIYGIFSWLIVEALFSFYYRVYFNIGVDIVLMAFLGYPLLKGIQSKKL
jgi:hypothetical protein